MSTYISHTKPSRLGPTFHHIPHSPRKYRIPLDKLGRVDWILGTLDTLLPRSYISAYASRGIEEGRLGEREILRKVTSTSPLHHWFKHIIHLLHEFKFESFVGKHICFVTDLFSYNIVSFQRELDDPPILPKFILRLMKDILKGL